MGWLVVITLSLLYFMGQCEPENKYGYKAEPYHPDRGGYYYGNTKKDNPDRSWIDSNYGKEDNYFGYGLSRDNGDKASEITSTYRYGIADDVYTPYNYYGYYGNNYNKYGYSNRNHKKDTYYDKYDQSLHPYYGPYVGYGYESNFNDNSAKNTYDSTKERQTYLDQDQVYTPYTGKRISEEEIDRKNIDVDLYSYNLNKQKLRSPEANVRANILNNKDKDMVVLNKHYVETIHSADKLYDKDDDSLFAKDYGRNKPAQDKYDLDVNPDHYGETGFHLKYPYKKKDFKDMSYYDKDKHRHGSRKVVKDPYGQHKKVKDIIKKYENDHRKDMCKFVYDQMDEYDEMMKDDDEDDQQHHYDEEYYHMDKYLTDLACKMFTSWGDNMQKHSKWEPTDHQRSWFESLGSRSTSKVHKHSRRYKRQLNNNNIQNNNPKDPRVLRKEYRMLNDEERYRLHRAMNVLKNTFMDGLSMYDVFVHQHQASVAPAAHFGPAFLGYHRELLLRFENALREVDPQVSLPYWDSNLDYILGDELAQQSILWSADFLGNGIGDVTTGPYSYWRMPFQGVANNAFLFRNLTVAPPFAHTMPALMTDESILHFVTSQSLRNLSWFVSPLFESNHGAVHNWVGGVMADLPISPSDPVFFMHHAFMDCLWEQMRNEQRYNNFNFDPQYDYPNDSAALGVGQLQPDGNILQHATQSYHYSTRPMYPFTPLRNIDGLHNIYYEQFYYCQPSPVCSLDYPNCGSKFLFCDLQTQRCAPRLQIGAICVGFENSGPCYQSQCCHGKCQNNCNSIPRRDFQNQQYEG